LKISGYRSAKGRSQPGRWATIIGIALLLLIMNYNHPLTTNARIYSAVTPVLPGREGPCDRGASKGQYPTQRRGRAFSHRSDEAIRILGRASDMNGRIASAKLVAMGTQSPCSRAVVADTGNRKDALGA